MLDNAGELCILNDVLQPAGGMGEVDRSTENVVYEVIRIIDRVPLFVEDHYVRLKSSMSLLGFALEITEKELLRQIQKIVDANKQVNCNVRVVIYRLGGIQNCLIYISKSHYPGNDEIANGVQVGLMDWERKNPNIKLVNPAYKDKSSASISENKVFEVLLVDSDGRITEGSKSNAFFVKGTKVFTAPSERILKGVTRKYILDACRNNGIEVIETLVKMDSLKDIEGVFITGTSIKVLPVSSVGGYSFKSSTHPTVVTIRDHYNRVVEDYINKRKG